VPLAGLSLRGLQRPFYQGQVCHGRRVWPAVRFEARTKAGRSWAHPRGPGHVLGLIRAVAAAGAAAAPTLQVEGGRVNQEATFKGGVGLLRDLVVVMMRGFGRDRNPAIHLASELPSRSRFF